jgi:hypothetical protein
MIDCANSTKEPTHEIRWIEQRPEDYRAADEQHHDGLWQRHANQPGVDLLPAVGHDGVGAAWRPDRAAVLGWQRGTVDRYAAASSSDGISSSMRKFLAEMMMRAERDKYLSRVNKESASGGSKASGSFGGSSGGLY